MNIYDELEWRGLIHTVSDSVVQLLDRDKVTLYVGFDPSASSLHVGSLLPLMVLARFQRFGHRPIAVIGGGTGLIGDPSGKSLERRLLSKEQVELNLGCIRAQIDRLLKTSASVQPSASIQPAVLVDNAEWLTNMSITDFLRDIGKHFSVNSMLGKESIKRRFEQQDGISYTEFSYLLLQAFDFLMLQQRYDCTLQIGGSDQWGNITAGTDLIRKTKGIQAYGLVFPLVTTASGAKFGKTEAGAVWLDGHLTSPYRFFQFWYNSSDQDVVKYLKYFTWLSRNEITDIEERCINAPETRDAQLVLAREVTRLVHGNEGLYKAEMAAKVLFGAEFSDMSYVDVCDIFSDVPFTRLPPSAAVDSELSIVDVLTKCKISTSKSDARRAINGGGIYLNNVRVSDENMLVTRSRAIDGKVVVIRKGRKQYHLVEIGE